ncbi:hypothetical protein sscle_06g049700 [Sclerotinia sclerotiorum 1980 UF-70]|uniref:Uncharacterized protein n=1 Tax=Sclerotinia sclerotiorum (strain ATCC 18683 / 1980 / Ss-1) TaxID=665079 RepID=A0A1D9Q5F7_SCLS1|nr:hypothetical protein sscle_06g049700 [Sclerotinia sclerotiorum 1980 UF-70]
MAAKVLALSLGPRRRSSRLQSRQRAVSIPYILGSQSPLEQRPTNHQPPQLVRATSYTHVPISTPIEVSAPVPSRTQFQDNQYSRPTHTTRLGNGGPTDLSRPVLKDLQNVPV